MAHRMNGTLAPINTSWFDKDPERYLARDDFQEFQKIAGVDFHDLLSHEMPVVERTQKKIISKSTIFNEIRNEHSGYSAPFLYYTHDFKFSQDIPCHNVELDKKVLAFSQGDSLRRRHIALSHTILPNVIKELANQQEGQISLKNLGSGIGLDVINAVKNTDGLVGQAWQYDVNPTAVGLGRRITSFLENHGQIQKGVIHYRPESLLNSNEKVDLVVLIGVICGLTDQAALTILKLARRMLRGGRGGGG